MDGLAARLSGAPPAPSVTSLWATRLIGASMAVGLVHLFEWFMMDRLLAVIWPQAALFDWIGERIF